MVLGQLHQAEGARTQPVYSLTSKKHKTPKTVRVYQTGFPRGQETCTTYNNHIC